MNTWTKPLIVAVVISAVGAGGLRFLRSQQHPEAPPPVLVTQAVEPAPEVRAPAPAPVAPPAPVESKPVAAPAPKAVAETPAPAQPASAPAAPTPATTGPATVRGSVKFTGEPPRRALIRMDADPQCAAAHTEEPPKAENLLLNENGTLQNVFVYVKTGWEGQTFPPPRTPVILDQQGCTYQPRVLGMQARQPLLIRNSDDTLHNVHAMPTRSKEFNIGQPNKGMETTRTFTTPEVMVKFKCDVHPWMAAYIGVLEHPFFSVTGATGEFTLKNLPPGNYTLEAWHEELGTRTESVKIGPGESRDITFTFAR